MNHVNYEDILEADERLKRYEYLPPTVLLNAPELAQAVGAKTVTLVLDTPKPLASSEGGYTFKLRGAANKVFSLLEKRSSENRKENINLVTASAGNHAQGVAAAASRAKQVGLLTDDDQVLIYMPTTAPEKKRVNTQKLGGNTVKVHLEGDTFDMAREKCEEFIHSGNGSIAYVHPFDDKDVIAGQGTLGKELFEKCKPDMVFAPCGGGGLTAGLLVAAKTLSPHTQVVGVEPNYAPSAYVALTEKGALRRVPSGMPNGNPVAGGITVRQIGKLPHRIMKEDGAHIHTVSQHMIEFATLWLHRFLPTIPDHDLQHAYDAELSAGAALAGLLNAPRKQVEGKDIAVVITGANLEIDNQSLAGSLHIADDSILPNLSDFPRSHSALRYSPKSKEVVAGRPT